MIRHRCKSSLALCIMAAFFTTCKSYRFEENGRVISDIYAYYLNDSLKTSLVLFGDMGEQGNPLNGGTSVSRFYPHDKKILKKFNVSKSESILFTSRPKLEEFYNLIGVFKTSDQVDASKYKLFFNKDSVAYMHRSLLYRGREAIENLLPFSENKYLSLIYYTSSSNDYGSLNDMHFFVDANLERIKHKKNNVSVSAVQLADKYFKSAGYLSASKLDERKADFPLVYERGEFNQILATYYSFSNQLLKADSVWNVMTRTDSTSSKQLKLFSAKEWIVEKAKTEQVLMFNQAHHQPNHAFFVGSLLQDLYAIGYRYLALECLENASSAISRGYPNLEDGYYLKDPVLGNLIRHALRLGYYLVSYEDYSLSRELGQARNLYKETFAKQYDAKVIVLAGYSHISEVPLNGKLWMAYHFKQLSGIDPYTVDQTTYMYSSIPNALEEDCYVVEQEPEDSVTDIRVKNMISTENRSNAFDVKSGAKNVSIKTKLKELRAKNRIYSLLVFEKSEILKDEKSIPVFVNIIDENHGEYVSCSLKRGEYLIQYRDVKNALLSTETILVSE